MPRDTNGPGRLNRRQFLSLTAVGASSWGLTGAVGARSGDRETVPLAKSGSEVVETREVPRSWKQGLERAKQARTQVVERLERRDDVGADSTNAAAPAWTVSVENDDRRAGDLPGFRVVVRGQTGAARDAAPAEANGVPVRTEEAGQMVPISCPNRGYYDPLPGATRGNADLNDDGTMDEGGGTFTTAVTTTDSLRTYMMTAAHGIESPYCDVDYGEDVYIDRDLNNKIGDVVDWDVGLDYALIKNTTGEVSFANRIREETDSGATLVDVGGHLPESGVAYWLSKNKEIRKSGTNTGVRTGTLTDMYEWAGTEVCFTFEGHGVRNDTLAGPGDSGSPLYGMIDGDAYMINMVQFGGGDEESACGGGVGYDNSGTAAYRMHEEDGIVWDV